MNTTPDFADLYRHRDHDVVTLYTGPKNKPTSVSIECADCNEVLVHRDCPEPLREFKTRKTYEIEMYVGRPMERGWYGVDVKIPVTTPLDRIDAVASAELRRVLGADRVDAAFHGVHFIPDLVDLDDEDE